MRCNGNCNPSLPWLLMLASSINSSVALTAPAGGSRVRNRGQLSTYDDFTIDRITLEIKESRPRSPTNAAKATPCEGVAACQLSPPARVDRRVNRGQTSGVIELSEQTVIDQLVVRLTQRYPGIAKSTVEGVVHGLHAKFDGRPLRDFIPLLVERRAKAALEQLRVPAG